MHQSHSSESGSGDEPVADSAVVSLVVGGNYQPADSHRRPAAHHDRTVTTVLPAPQASETSPSRIAQLDAESDQGESEAEAPALSAVARAVAAAEQRSQPHTSVKSSFSPPPSVAIGKRVTVVNPPQQHRTLPATPASRMSAVPAHLRGVSPSSLSSSASPSASGGLAFSASPLSLSSPSTRIVNGKMSLLSEMERLQQQLDSEMEALQSTRQRLSSLVEQGRERALQDQLAVERAIEVERRRLEADRASQQAEEARAEQEAVQRADTKAAALLKRARGNEAQFLRGEFDTRVPLHTGKMRARQQAAILLLLAERDHELSELRARREQEVLSRLPLEGSDQLPPAFCEAHRAAPSALAQLHSGTCSPEQLSDTEHTKFLLVQKLFHSLDRREREQKLAALRLKQQQEEEAAAAAAAAAAQEEAARAETERAEQEETRLRASQAEEAERMARVQADDPDTRNDDSSMSTASPLSSSAEHGAGTDDDAPPADATNDRCPSIGHSSAPPSAHGSGDDHEISSVDLKLDMTQNKLTTSHLDETASPRSPDSPSAEIRKPEFLPATLFRNVTAVSSDNLMSVVEEALDSLSVSSDGGEPLLQGDDLASLAVSNSFDLDQQLGLVQAAVESLPLNGEHDASTDDQYQSDVNAEVDAFAAALDSVAEHLDGMDQVEDGNDNDGHQSDTQDDHQSNNPDGHQSDGTTSDQPPVDEGEENEDEATPLTGIAALRAAFEKNK
mmetsp:Transcript_6009/g.18370  ORF Transcript_6009/g.18370 Transcript_6009/m.18370 type:complete len:732 (+) Transcript_6009:90-2285(+)